MGSLKLRERDAGLSLVELIVAMGLGLIVLTMVGTFMISSFASSQQVTTTTQATTQAQLTARQLENQLRTASAVHVETNATTGSQVLIARVRTGTGGGDWQCEAWYYDAEVGAILHTTYAGESTWPWGSSVLNWIDLGSGLTGIVDVGDILGDTLTWLFGGSASTAWTVMAVDVAAQTDSSGDPLVVFAGSGKSATIQFAAASDNGTPVVISTTVTGRQPLQGTDPTCF